MRSLRHLGFALWLALAVVVGQQAAALHSLAHANESLSHKKGVPAQSQCETCSQLAGFAGAMGAHCAATSVVDASPPRALLPRERLADLSTRLAYLSRAPPALS
jgi:hypothetical protein